MKRNTNTASVLRLLLLTLVTLLTAQRVSANHDSLSSVGTEFVSYQTCNRDHTPVQWLFVTTPENVPVDFSVSDGMTTVYHTVAPNSNQTIDVCSTFSTVSEVQGILIRSSDGVSKLVVMELVFVHNDISSDSFTVFPPHHYTSYNYFALSVEPTNSLNYRSFVQIVGSEDNTQVTITPTQDASIPAVIETNCSGTTITAGTTCTLNLQKLQALHLLSEEDLTGTKIVSDKPLSVFSGADCAKILGGNCETLIEQIPPVATWGKTFLVGSIEGRAEEIYKVVAAKANTKVSVYCVNSTNHFCLSFNLLGEGSSHNISAGLQRTCSIRADKPILLMLLAPNSYHKGLDGAFMSLVPPVRQYTNTVTVIMPHGGNMTITLPVESCPGSHCSVIVDESHTLTTTSAPIHCSLNEVCGYVMVANLSAGVHKLRTPDVETGMGVTAYAFTSNLKTGYGTISALGLNYIAVDSPEIVVEVGRGSGGHPLVAGDSLTLTCHVTVTQKGMSDGVTMSVEWFKGEENEEIKSASVIDVHDKEIGSYTFEHSFEALSTEDSNTYKCEASLWFQTIGLLATASHSMDITVQEPPEYGYFQLLFSGVGMCKEWKFTDTAEKVDKLTEEAVSIIREGCGCDFSSHFISSPILQCLSTHPESSDQVLFRARIQKGGGSPVTYSDVMSYLEGAKDTPPFDFKGLLLHFDEVCSVEIEDLQDQLCFDNTSVCTSGIGGSNKMVVVVPVVAVSCVVVLLLVLAIVIVVGVVITHRHDNSKQRPRSIHLHQRMGSAGESVTSFSPDPSGSGSNIYVQKDSYPSSPTSRTAMLSLPTSPTDKTPPTLPTQNGFTNATTHELEQNFKAMKADLAVNFSDV